MSAITGLEGRAHNTRTMRIRVYKKYSSLLSVLTILFLPIVFLPLFGQATGIQWEGRYLVEGIMINQPSLSDAGGSQMYGLHHLALRPEIVPADGFIIRGRFDILNNPAYPNSQLGQVIGSGPNDSTRAGDTVGGLNAEDRNTLTSTQRAELLAINELYLTWINEYGALVVGRAPLHFGLGVSYNAGLGPFDHWFDNRDMLAYKFQLGNFYVMPMYAKIAENQIGSDDDVTEYLLQFEYANPETELAVGAMYRMRRSNTGANDMAAVEGDPVDTPIVSDLAFAEDQISVFFKQFVGPVKMGFEGNFLSGNFGVHDASGQNVKLNGMGLAFELDQDMTTWAWGLRAGYVTGDDPTTTDVYEGFITDRNYDVAMLLYNRVLGNAGLDPLRTGLNRRTVAQTENAFDVESISNTMYLAPRFEYRFTEQWRMGGAFIYGALLNEPVVGSGTDLGYELDLSVSYLPNERVTWKTEVGFLFPGDAFTGGPTNNFDNGFTYGLTTKAAINF